ncbi:MAG: bifunctional nuclease family protein [Thermofilaceae archaeon]|nr:bifunctional nuclease family protein [Thermofilaceae archaeon]MDW8003530.1 bifunctional nuclease family protein [Thermofilaceae archaeon]
MEGEIKEEGYTRADIVGVYNITMKSGNVEYPYGAVMLLKGEGWDQLVLPIYIGSTEAESIARAMYGWSTPRPMTHDLIVSMLGALGVKVEKITVDALIEDVYTATIVLTQEVNGRVKRHYIDARPSDSVAIAVRTGAPILLSEKLKTYAQDERKFIETRDLI